MGEDTPKNTEQMEYTVEDLEGAVIRFAGDSGDGMQLTGEQFSNASFALGHDLSTMPDYPSEIRAPAGTTAGVSGFQIQFSSHEIYTPGDAPHVLVVMNPAALKVNIKDVVPGGLIIANTSTFTESNLKKAGYETNPLSDGSLSSFRILEVDVTKFVMRTLVQSQCTNKEKQRCKNFFALGLLYWLFNHPLWQTVAWLREKFVDKPLIADANISVLRAGYRYGERTPGFSSTYRVPPAKIKPGRYRTLTGNRAISLGLVAASQLSGLPLFLGTYPITPASEILHELSCYKNYGVTTFQAEDEIAGISAAIGASYGGRLAVTTTSGPGLSLKTESIGLAVMLELPLVIFNVQRAGPSTGMPTKTEQADLLAAMFGRHGESPLPVLAPGTPSECFFMAIEACRMAIKYMTPVIVLSDTFIANSSEPWRIPDPAHLPHIKVDFHKDRESFAPYRRNPATLARPWVRPGTPGLMHRIGGLEKDFYTGNVSYDPLNHQQMVKTRAKKIAGIAKRLPKLSMTGPKEGDLLILGWGSTTGAVHQAVETLREEEGIRAAAGYLKYINPFQKELGSILKRFDKILIPELNTGQLRLLINARYGVQTAGLSKVQGRPFRVDEIVTKAHEVLGE